jgi:D-sedoheptulose 7-phosphate isomerase
LADAQLSNIGMTAIRAELVAARDLLSSCLEDSTLQQALLAVAHSVVATMRAGGRVLLAGNGGSAADAQHIAGEFVSRFHYDRPALCAIALTTDTSILTAIGNDYGYEDIFSRQVQALGRAGDVFWGISTSGRSPNIVKALETARSMNITTIGFTGENPRAMGPACDHLVCVPSGVTPHIQQVHIIGAHIVCALVEQSMFPRAG